MKKGVAGASREARAQQVKAAVLDAAVEIFAEKGFEGSTLGEIAARSGAKQPLIVYHFGNKEALWEAAATQLMSDFNHRQVAYYDSEVPEGDRERLHGLLRSFIRALRDLPAYGKLLLREGSGVSPRVQWLDHHFVPKVYRDAAFQDPALRRVFGTVNLLRYAIAGSVLYIVVAGPQLAVSAAEEGAIGDPPDQLYPLSDAMVERLAEMLCDFVFSYLNLHPSSR